MSIQQMVMQLAGGMGISIQIFVVTLIVSLPLGLVVAFGRMSRNKVLQTIVKVYISVMRGTPLMLQLMVVYFGPYYLFGIRVGTSFGPHLSDFPSIMPLILRRFTGAAYSPCRPDNMRLPIFWATAGSRHFSRSFFRR